MLSRSSDVGVSKLKNWKQMMSIHVISEYDIDNFIDNLRQKTKV